MEPIPEDDFDYSIRTTLRDLEESLDVADISVDGCRCNATELGDVEEQPSLVDPRMFVVPGSHRTSASGFEECDVQILWRCARNSISQPPSRGIVVNFVVAIRQHRQ